LMDTINAKAEPKGPWDNLMSNPFLHMGLGILSNPQGTGSAASAIGGGILGGMRSWQGQNMATAKQQEEALQKKLWATQLLHQQYAMTPNQRTDAISDQVVFVNDQTGERVYGYVERTPKGALIRDNRGAVRPDLGEQPWRVVKPEQEGGDTSRAVPAYDPNTGEQTGWVAPPTLKPGEYLPMQEGITTAKPGSSSSGKEKLQEEVDYLDLMLSDFDALELQMIESPQGLGNVGAFNKKAHAVGQFADWVIERTTGLEEAGTGVANWVAGPDATDIGAGLRQHLQKVARYLVDQSGPLATQEQRRAAQLLGLDDLGREVEGGIAAGLGPKQAMTYFKKTSAALKKLRDFKKKRLGIDVAPEIGEMPPQKSSGRATKRYNPETDQIEDVSQ
jgi:hypothetical protein